MKLAEQIVHEDLRSISEQLPELTKLAGKTVLITGGAGFIGNYLVLTLAHISKELPRPIKIVSVDNFITGSRKQLLTTPSYNSYRFVEHDVRQPYTYTGKVEYVIHAAGIASPIYYKKYPVEAIEVGTQGTKNFLELARKKQSKSFVFFSSSEIYGDPDSSHIPTDETYRGNVSSIGPRSCYDESKRLGEALTMTYITDAIVAIFKVLLSDKNGEVYNVGNDNNEMPMIKLAQQVVELIPGEGKIVTIPYPQDYPADEPKRRCPDLTKIAVHLGFKPKVDLETGLERLLAWYRSEYKI